MSSIVQRYRYAGGAQAPASPGKCGKTKEVETGGLEGSLLALAKGATAEREAAGGGARGGWGTVSQGRRFLEARAAAKRELQEIHGRLPGVC